MRNTRSGQAISGVLLEPTYGKHASYSRLLKSAMAKPFALAGDSGCTNPVVLTNDDVRVRALGLDFASLHALRRVAVLVGFRPEGRGSDLASGGGPFGRTCLAGAGEECRGHPL